MKTTGLLAVSAAAKLLEMICEQVASHMETNIGIMNKLNY